MAGQEKLRCNICDAVIETGEAKEHAAQQSHAEKKARLESELAVAKGRAYGDDNSVATLWVRTR